MKLATLLLLVVLLLSGLARPPDATHPDTTLPSTEDYVTERKIASAPHPPRNLYELQPRLTGADPARLKRIVGSTQDWTEGRRERFWVSNLHTNEYTQRPATLQYVSGNAYWWVEDGRQFSQGELRVAAERFDRIAIKDRSTFGSEWRPGVDRDPRIVVLIASTPGAGGYYSSADEYPRAINPFSNEHEMIYIDAPPGDSYFDSTLAHEFQHMIHWYEHASQDVWINEGMAEYAVELNGYNDGLPEHRFAETPDTQLNTWADSPDAAAVHYGQAYRIMSYLSARFGAGFLSTVIDARGSGLDAIDQALRSLRPRASLRNVYADWLVANLLVDRGRGALGYKTPMSPVQVTKVDSSFEKQSTVRQWGADYYGRKDNEPFRLTFQASPRVKLVGNGPNSGRFEWYSNRGDLLDSTLTRKLDLSGVTKATLEMDLWYDIETDFDYGYIEISLDDGRTWRTLPGSRTADTNPNGNNLGNGYTGQSDGWITERFDLSRYAGRKALLRVEYVTDDGYNAQGLAVDGVHVPEIGLDDDSETGDKGWVSNGWVRSSNWLPARYRLLVLDPNAGGSYVEAPVGADGRAVATFSPHGEKPPVVIVGGVSWVTTQPSTYRLELEPAGPGLLGTLGGRVQPAAAP